MTPVRKEALKRLGFIFLGVIIMLFLSDYFKLRYAAIAILIFTVHNFIKLVRLLPEIVDDFYPPKIKFEQKASPFDKVIHDISGYFLLGAVILYIFEDKMLDNTINSTKLFWLSAVIGILIAITITAILKKVSPSIYYERNRRFVVHFSIFIGFFIITPTIASFINHTYASDTKTCKTYEVVKKTTGGRNESSHWLYVNIDKREECFIVPTALFNKVGSQVQLCTREGKLGYDFVEEFNQ